VNPVRDARAAPIAFPDVGRWQEQWDSAGRWLEKTRAVYEGRAGGAGEARDVLYACFQSIHHLRDWIKNDPGSGLTKPDLQGLPSSDDVKIVAEIANGSKHLKLTPAAGRDTSTSVTRADIDIDAGARQVRRRFYVDSRGKRHDALELAERAVQEWDAFLRKHGLL
jgi:hypothetical protein